MEEEEIKKLIDSRINMILDEREKNLKLEMDNKQRENLKQQAIESIKEYGRRHGHPIR